MYNEEREELNYTMSGVFLNFASLIDRGSLNGDDIVVFMITDGIDGLTNDFLDYG